MTGCMPGDSLADLLYNVAMLPVLVGIQDQAVKMELAITLPRAQCMPMSQYAHTYFHAPAVTSEREAQFVDSAFC